MQSYDICSAMTFICSMVVCCTYTFNVIITSSPFSWQRRTGRGEKREKEKEKGKGKRKRETKGEEGKGSTRSPGPVVSRGQRNGSIIF